MDKRIEAFLAVARTGTATSAAGQLHVAQSAITKRIANLEADIGTRLFLRDRRGMSLTDAGGLFLARAERIEREYRDGFEEVAAISAAGLTALKVGAGPVFHLDQVAGLFTLLVERFPDLKLDLQTLRHSDQADRLISGDIDVYLGIIAEKELDSSIFTKPLTMVEHGIVMRAADPNSRTETVDPGDLVDYRWVSFVIDPVTERSIEENTIPTGTRTPLIDIRTSSFATGVQLVKTGHFLMSAPLQLADTVEKEGLVIRPVKNGMPRRRAGVHVRKSLLGYGAVQAVIEYFEAQQR